MGEKRWLVAFTFTQTENRCQDWHVRWPGIEPTPFGYGTVLPPLNPLARAGYNAEEAEFRSGRCTALRSGGWSAEAVPAAIVPPSWAPAPEARQCVTPTSLRGVQNSQHPAWVGEVLQFPPSWIFSTAMVAGAQWRISAAS